MTVTTRSGRSTGQTTKSSAGEKRKTPPSKNTPHGKVANPKKPKTTTTASSHSKEHPSLSQPPSSSAENKKSSSAPATTSTTLLANPPHSTASSISLTSPLTNTPKTLFALFLAADLSSARINHDIAFKSTTKLIERGWDDVYALHNSTWEERTEALTEGGYTRYRERTATFLGDVAGLVVEKYDGDLRNLFKAAEGDIKKTRELLKEFKGMGDVGVDIFLRDAQMFYDYLVPFADKKALKVAEKAGIGKTAEELYEAVGKDVWKLSALCTSLVIGG